jgi:hypothetical protein
MTNGIAAMRRFDKRLPWSSTFVPVRAASGSLVDEIGSYCRPARGSTTNRRLKRELAMRFSTLAFVTLVISCGGSQPPAEPPPAAPPPAPTAAPAPPAAPEAPPSATAAPPSVPEAPAAPAAVAWKDMNKEQRIEFMKTMVLPKMKPEFISYDAKRYAEMSCVTCHGEGAKKGSFKMPNPKLPKVPATMDGFKKLMAAKPKAVEFMAKTVVPTMASLLGEEPFDPSTGKGFGCHNCHTTQK